MTKVIFTTSGKINYQFSSYTLYKSIEMTARGERFPGLEKESKVGVERMAKKLAKLNPDILITATSRQCLETALKLQKIIKFQQVIKSKNLLPLKFDLKTIIEEKEFLKMGDQAFNKLRMGYLNAFFENKLIDNNIEVKRRFAYISKRIKKVSGRRNKVIIILSHAYLIKLFYIYYKMGDSIFSKRKELFKLFQPEKETMKRLETLEINL